MSKFIGLYTEKSSPYEFSMVDSSAMRTITISRIEGHIMDKSIKVLVYFIADTHLFRVGIN